MKIPSNREWTQDNSGDLLGVLGDTTNMAFDTVGKAIVARKSVSVCGSRDSGSFNYPLSIDYFNGDYVVLTDDEIFTFDLPDFNLDQVSWTPATGLNSDAVVFNDLYTITTDNDLYTWDGGSTSGAWEDRNVSLTSGVPHPMAVFGTQIAVGNANTVKLVTTSYTVSQTLTLPTEFQVTTVRAVGSYLYIGTKNLNGGNAKIFVWNGDSSAFDYECEVGASWVFSLTPYLSSVAAITSEGQLGVVAGTTFSQLAALPVYYDPHARWQGSGGLLLNGKVFNRGMCTIGETIYLNIEGEIDSTFMPEMKSGVWVYDPAVGLYHRASATGDQRVRDTGLSLSDNTLTTSAAHKLKTGDAVSFDTTSGLSGVDADRLYYVTVISSTELKLSLSRKGVQSENYVTITGTPSVADTLVYAQNGDYSNADATSGAITAVTYAETASPNLTSEIIWGSRFSLPDNTTEYGLFTFSDSYNIGSFVTQRKYSDNLEQTWQSLYNFIDGLMVDTEEVVVKAQTTYEPPSTELSGVWLNATTLNSANTKDFAAWQDIEIGYEVVVIDGYGRGQTAHVAAIESSSSVVSLTLDEALGTANETCTIYYTPFKKVGVYTRENVDKGVLKATMDNLKAPWIAAKVELRGFGLTVNMLDLQHTVHKKT